MVDQCLNYRENENAEILIPKDHIQIEVKSKDEKGYEKKEEDDESMRFFTGEELNHLRKISKECLRITLQVMKLEVLRKSC